MVKYQRDLNSTVSRFELISSWADVGQGSMTDDNETSSPRCLAHSRLVFALIVRHHCHLTLIITLNTLSSPALPSHLLDIISPSMDAATHIWMRAFAAADVILRITPNTKHQTIITSTTKIWSSTAVSNTRILKYVRHRSSCIRSGEIWAALKMYETYMSQ